ncbi:MAG: amino acid transporter [Planctomycetia bacterium 21-64-5]|nr:MAG: amino acid transporter [Planctomycetia bacterium 21-64-5]
MSFLSLLLGRPLASSEQAERKIGVFAGVPALGLDGLSSSAYGPEAALTILLPLGLSGVWYIGPITVFILLLLGLLYLSYRQTIGAYPVNGGSYTVAKENLGTNASLLAAAALMIDYVLTVAVGISAGVAALVSAVPSLHKYTLPMCMVILLLITLANLRGTKDAGWVFAAPTYLFIGALGCVLITGIVKAIASGGQPQPLVAPPPVPKATEVVGLWLLLRSFASGCTAMTGVEAVSNGVSAFEDPTVRFARRTLTVIVVILAMLLGGVSYLAQSYHVGAMDQNQPGYQSVLSQLTAAVVGRGGLYYVTIGSVLTVLCLSANTSFVDFPRLCRLVAGDDFMPRSFAVSGRRLVYSVGILFLAASAGVLLFAFDGITDRLIPLYAVGAFTAFTLSQAGMVVHWRKVLRGPQQRTSQNKASNVEQPGANPPEEAGSRGRVLVRMAVNAAGGTATGMALAIILAAKFLEGAWITIVAVPVMLSFFKLIRRHYRQEQVQTGAPGPLRLSHNEPPVVVMPIRAWDRLAGKSLRFAMRLSPDVIALHLSHLSGDADDDAQDTIQQQWSRDVAEPARQAGLPAPRLEVVNSPYRTLVEPLLAEIGRIETEFPHRIIAVIVPMLVQRHWWQWVLHTRRASKLRAALMQKEDSRVVVISVPWYLHD